MFSVISCIGGTTIIKNNDSPIAWIDIFGDLQFLDLLESSKKSELISFLDDRQIPYNKDL